MSKIKFPSRPSWLQRLTLTVSSVLVIVAGFALASALFMVLLVVGIAVGGWLWWKLRRIARQTSAAAPNIIEGEYSVVETTLLLKDARRDVPHASHTDTRSQ